MYTQTHVHAHMRAHMHICKHWCTHIHIPTLVHTYAHTDTPHTCTYRHIHTQVRAHTLTNPHCTHRYSPCTYSHACTYVHRGRVGYSHLYSFVSICCFFRIVTTNFWFMFILCPHSPHSYVLECFISPSSQHQRHWETTIKSDSSLSSWLHHASQRISSPNP